jgi:hypothetical protein
LQILKVVCEDQRQALSEWERYRSIGYSKEAQNLTEQYNRKVNAMEEQAVATYNAVSLELDWVYIATMVLTLIAQ